MACAVITAFSYGYSISDDPRMSDGSLDYGEANIGELILFSQALIVSLGALFYAVTLAFCSGRWGWFFTVLMLWPLAFVYLFKHFGENPSKQSVTQFLNVSLPQNNLKTIQILFFSSFIPLSLFYSYLTHYERYELPMNGVTIASVIIFYLLMVRDFSKRKTLKNRTFWGVLLLVGSWIGASIYFFKIYCQTTKTILPFSTSQKYSNLFKLLYFSFCITLVHNWLLSHLSLIYSIHSNSIYQLLVNDILYKPFTFSLVKYLELNNISTEVIPNTPTRVTIHFLNFAYTAILYVAAMLAFSKIKEIFTSQTPTPTMQTQG